MKALTVGGGIRGRKGKKKRGTKEARDKRRRGKRSEEESNRRGEKKKIRRGCLFLTHFCSLEPIPTMELVKVRLPQLKHEVREQERDR